MRRTRTLQQAHTDVVRVDNSALDNRKFVWRLEKLRKDAIQFVASSHKQPTEDDRTRVVQLIADAKSMYAEEFCKAIRLKPVSCSDYALQSLDRTRGKLSRWEIQCLTLFAYYVDLEAKLRFNPDLSEGFPIHSKADQFLNMRYLKSSDTQADIRHLATAYELLSQLKTNGTQNQHHEVVVELSNCINEFAKPLSVELALLQACLTYWISILEHEKDQALVFRWMGDWLPIGGTGTQTLLIWLEVWRDNSPNAGFVPAFDRKYVLKVTNENMPIKVINLEGRKRQNSSGKVEVEWELDVPSVVVGRNLHVSVVCSGMDIAPMLGEFNLRPSSYQLENVDPNELRPNLDKLNSTIPVAERDEILFDALVNALCKSFNVSTDDDLAKGGVLIDRRSGRFLSNAFATHKGLAERLIQQIVVSMVKSGWWYVSRPQINSAIEALVKPRGDSSVDSIVEEYMTERFSRSSIIADDRPHDLCLKVLVEILNLVSNNQTVNLDTLAQASIRSRYDDLRDESVHLPGLVTELVKCEILSKSAGRYSFSNGFVRSWVERQSRAI